MMNKEDAAKKVLGAMTFDCALPQTWVNDAALKGHDVRPHFVWAYPKGDIWGLAFPITQAGFDMAGQVLEGHEMQRLKQMMFHFDLYAIKPPPVPTRYWGETDWINYIDNGYGRWGGFAV